MSRLRVVLAIVAALSAPGIAHAGVATPAVDPGVVFVGAGDIATCDNDHDAATAELIEQIDGEVYTLGDNVYDQGSHIEFMACYDPTWGAFLDRTYPVPGNHDYLTPDAEGYFAYFDERAGETGKGYYAFDLGEWRVMALNSNCHEIGGCEPGSPQVDWLETELEVHPTHCSLAYMHHPFTSSGGHDDDVNLDAIWQLLYDHGVDVVLAGHDHTYERFAPQAPGRVLDPEHGIVQFVVGTGGGPLRDFEQIRPHSVTRSSDTFGVLELELEPQGYGWRFVPVEGATFTDTGWADCHGRPDGRSGIVPIAIRA